ncbi:UNVERIFIED_CONTAM: hypothetical protein Slati_2207700 [Sesamum latifolium]|uniref:Reverse transcriptase n=1 Tax=Sesamum latifolium TaxID=2727402 RepID=A0AAW2WT64_9LAMI
MVLALLLAKLGGSSPDAITKACTRLDFARVCVMLDYHSTLPKHIVVMSPSEDGLEIPCRVDMEYEWIPSKCTQCCSLGHSTAVCPTNRKPSKPPVKVYVSKPVVVPPMPTREDETEEVSEPTRAMEAEALSPTTTKDGYFGTNLWILLDGVGDDPWIVLGDFNTVLYTSEICGLASDSHTAMDDFATFLNDTGLVVLPARGAIFTWHNCSRDVDHSPLFLHGAASLKDGRCFRFDNYLAKSPGFIDLVRSVWEHPIVGTPMYSITRKLKALKPKFRAKRKEKGDLTANDGTAVLLKATLLEQRRRAAQKIFQITSDSGARISDEPGVAGEFVRFYMSLLGGQSRHHHINLMFLQAWARYVIPTEEGEAMTRPIIREEVKEAFFDIAEDKAPGPDGYSAGFFKAAWSVIGDELTAAIQDFFVSGKLLKQVNATVLSLIPKVANPTTVAEFRPISCCNVLYKAITKIIVQRMSGFMDKLVIPRRMLSYQVGGLAITSSLVRNCFMDITGNTSHLGVH